MKALKIILPIVLLLGAVGVISYHFYTQAKLPEIPEVSQNTSEVYLKDFDRDWKETFDVPNERDSVELLNYVDRAKVFAQEEKIEEPEADSLIYEMVAEYGKALSSYAVHHLGKPQEEWWDQNVLKMIEDRIQLLYSIENCNCKIALQSDKSLTQKLKKYKEAIDLYRDIRRAVYYASIKTTLSTTKVQELRELEEKYDQAQYVKNCGVLKDNFNAEIKKLRSKHTAYLNNIIYNAVSQLDYTLYSEEEYKTKVESVKQTMIEKCKNKYRETWGWGNDLNVSNAMAQIEKRRREAKEHYKAEEHDQKHRVL